MGKAARKFEDIASDLVSVATWREALVSSALDALERRHPKLAQAVLENTGSRRRAGLWICAPRQANGGRSPCELLADGDEDGVWDLLEIAGRGKEARQGSHTNLLC
jgi:acyl-CoA reductase-like NAD-dependent aldehyde dehydrogenase